MTREKRQRIKTSKMRLRSIFQMTRRSKTNMGGKLARAIQMNKLISVIMNDGHRPRKHRARIPGTVRPSRMAGGSGFRNNWES